MPAECGSGFALSDLLTIVGLVVTLSIQSWAFWRWLSSQFDRRDREIDDAVRERNVMVTAIRNEASVARDAARADIARVDRDIASLRNEVSVKLAMIPTREAMESMLRDRVLPLESDLRALVIELARLGVHQPPRRET